MAIEWTPCKNCGEKFEITADDQAFYEKIGAPAPMWCPSCRHLRRHGWINDYVYYSRRCDHCEKGVISIFPPKCEYIVHCNDCWYSEKRNDRDAAREYDFSRGFFEQFDELLHAVPQSAMMSTNNLNSEYCESIANCKNCYLISESSNCEDCFYGYWLQQSKDCLECTYAHECERCYELFYCFGCYNLRHSQNCFQCSDSYFLDNCIGCRNCLFSTNLRHKEYYIFNKPYTKEQYFEEIKKLRLADAASLKNLQTEFQKFLSTQPRKNLQIENAENCSGDYIRHAKSCKQVFHCYDAEECAYGEHVWRGAKYCYDSNTAGRNAELLYETTNSGIDSYNVKFCRYCWGSADIEYSIECKNGKHLFGCASLKPGAQYCILNKQYPKEEYQKMVVKIKKAMLERGEYGEFFPLSMSLFGYNNSVSFDEFPLSKAEVLKRGWKWEDQESATKGKGTIEMKNLPKPITLVDEKILKEVLTCAQCDRNYKIIPQELSFYQKMAIPLPLRCPDCRHRARLALRHQKILHQTLCSECKKEITTTLNVTKNQQIFCAECYQKLVY